MNKVWSKAEEEYIRRNAATMTDKQIASELSILTNRIVTLQAVRKKRQTMKIKKRCGRGRCELDDGV